MGDTHRDLVTRLCAERNITSERVKASMLSVDRQFYTSRCPYVDSPQVTFDIVITVHTILF